MSSCIGDDIIDDRVDPEIRVTNLIDTIALNSSYQFEATFFNNVGRETATNFFYNSSDESIISINDQGLATALSLGAVTITTIVEFEGANVEETFDLVVGNETTVVPESLTRNGVIRTTTFYDLEGNFIIEKTGDEVGIRIDIDDTYRASTSLPGFYVYLTNNPNSIAGAYEIGEVTTFEGAHSYEIPDVGINDFGYLLYFCKPFNVKVGDGKIE